MKYSAHNHGERFLCYFAVVHQWRKILNQVKLLAFKIYISLLFLKAYIKNRNTKVNSSWSAHILIVNNSQYIDLAKIASYSFLNHNKGVKLNIHTDVSLSSEINFKFKGAVKRGLVDITIHTEWKEEKWQVCKLDLLRLVAQNGDLYFDADTRWFTNFTPTKDPIFLVREYSLTSRFPYRNFIKTRFSNASQDWHMLNTSVVFFGTQLTKNEIFIEDIQEIHNDYLGFLDKLDLGEIDKLNLYRLTEQLAISVATQKNFSEIGLLKEKDLIRDRKIVDSCYFGATGSKYFRIQIS